MKVTTIPLIYCFSNSVVFSHSISSQLKPFNLINGQLTLQQPVKRSACIESTTNASTLPSHNDNLYSLFFFCKNLYLYSLSDNEDKPLEYATDKHASSSVSFAQAVQAALHPEETKLISQIKGTQQSQLRRRTGTSAEDCPTSSPHR
jgi:hypothetical protein